MSCRVENGKGIAPNGKESELFRTQLTATADMEQATMLYDQWYL